MSHRVTIAMLRTLQRMAVQGVPVHEAARRTGEKNDFVKYWARTQHIRFVPMQNRGLPAWLIPEAARQAEDALRASLQRVSDIMEGRTL